VKTNIAAVCIQIHHRTLSYITVIHFSLYSETEEIFSIFKSLGSYCIEMKQPLKGVCCSLQWWYWSGIPLRSRLMRSFNSCGTSLYCLRTYLLPLAYILVAGHENVMFVRVLRRRNEKKDADFSTANRPVIFSPYFHSKCKQLFRAFSSTVCFLAAMLERKQKYTFYVPFGKEKDYAKILTWLLTNPFTQFCQKWLCLVMKGR
jgi:hypothetical protein